MRPKVEYFVDLDAVADDAAGALDRGAQASPYDTLDWLRLTRRHVLPETPLLVVRARGAAGTAWLVLAMRSRRVGEAFASWYTLRFAPIFVGSTHAPDRLALLIVIARSLRRRASRIALQPLASEDLRLVRQAFSTAGWLTGDAVHTVNWIAHTAGDDFAAYWAKRGSQLRNTTKRKAAKAGLDIRLRDAFDASAWADYERVFAASWKGDEGSPAFLRAFAERAGAWGSLRMALGYSAQGEPLAAQFWTIDGPIATIHKLAYVDAAKQLSPGTVLSRAMFEHVIARDAPAIIDFGTGDDPYKADWMDEKRPLHRFDAYNPLTVTGLAGYARMRLALVAGRRTA